MRHCFAASDGWPLLTSYRALSTLTRGCPLMLLGTQMFAAMHAANRYPRQQLPAVEAAFFRNLFGLVVICAAAGALWPGPVSYQAARPARARPVAFADRAR